MSEIVSETHIQQEDDFHALVLALQSHAEEVIKKASGRVFRVKTNARNELSGQTLISEVYLSGFPEGHARNHHRCNTCLDFLERYGGLVVLSNETLTIQSVFWNEDLVSDYFRQPIKNLRELVESLPINEVFHPDATFDVQFGVEMSGGYHHFHFDIHQLCRSAGYKARSESREDFRILRDAIIAVKHPKMKEAMGKVETLFKHDQTLSRIDHHAKMVGWFHMLVKQWETWPSDGPPKNNLVWDAVGQQSKGYLHIWQGVLGELIRNVADSDDPELVGPKRKYLTMVDPLTYQRAQAAATAGNIAAAEKIVKDLGLERSLLRRNATFDDIPERAYFWRETALPVQDKKKERGVFDHLRNDGTHSHTAIQTVNGGKITWASFLAKHLKNAFSIQVHLGTHTRLYNFCGLVTAVDPTAPPLFRHDKPEARNPVTTYVYHNGSSLQQWQLQSVDGWYTVKGFIRSPYLWNEEMGEDEVFSMLLDHGVDRNAQELTIFPSLVIPELHAVRSTIEMFSKKGVRENADQGICGIAVTPTGQGHNHRLRIRTSDGYVEYEVISIA